ncbi:hypothetical protein [Brochothrix campestris]|uniref:Uncharacterized protein n=1 Tax=Brochothrix campestris FSL F6-1037 TaxID=1265861 RepID=W7CSK2_9LIST|nr:hypothetical protein [Brochothrix campestris]EUJ39852.1 hypothetical protein BCAMP_06610 [Brochothrix campestris FSL F6-1037]
MTLYWQTPEHPHSSFQPPQNYDRFYHETIDGLLAKNTLATIEPTSYGFDFLEVYRVLPIEAVTTVTGFEHEQTLAGTTFYFAKDGPRMLGFHYRTHSIEPTVIFADFETLNSFQVAASLTAFNEKLQLKLFEATDILTWSADKIAFHIYHYDTTAFIHAIQAIEDYPDKNFWTTVCQRRFKRGQPLEQQAIATAVLDQVLYFRRKLPADWLIPWQRLLNTAPTASTLALIEMEW